MKKLPKNASTSYRIVCVEKRAKRKRMGASYPAAGRIALKELSWFGGPRGVEGKI